MAICSCCGKHKKPAGLEGLGTALKPAMELIALARKPLSEPTVALNCLRWGVGALNIDATRIATDENLNGGAYAKNGTERHDGAENWRYKREGSAGAYRQPLGRWPANVLHDGSPEVLAGFPDAGVSAGGSRGAGGQNGCYSPIGAQPDFKPGFGDSGSAARFFACFPTESETCTQSNANAAEKTFSLSSERAVSVLSHAVEASTERLALRPQSYRGQDMNVSENQLEDVSTLLTAIILHLEKRFLRGLLPERHSLSSSLANIVAIPKPIGTIAIMISLSKSSGFVDVVTFDLIETNAEAGVEGYAKRFHYTSKADADDRLNSKHPTVKPVDLIAWLVRLICPKNGTVLDPFAGTGTTGAATFREGCRAVLIEREAEYLADIERRMELLLSGPDERARKLAKADPHESLPLFGAV